MGFGTDQGGHSSRRAISTILLRVGTLGAIVAIVFVGVLVGLDTPESETRVAGTVTGVYQRPEVDSDVPNPVEFLVRLDSGERIQATLSEPAAFRPGKRALLTERTTKYGRKLYRFERYLDPQEGKDPLGRPSAH